MTDLRPVGYVIGWLVALLGVAMAFPAGVDLIDGDPNASAFLGAMVVTLTTGCAIGLACANGRRPAHRLSTTQGFTITTVAWLVFTAFATLPLTLGAPHLDFVDALFETTSAMTTSGGTVIVGLEHMPRSVLLWRGLLQWIGGLGVVLFAIILLPLFGVGGMQLLRAADFNTLDKILPRAKEIALAFGAVYLFLSIACALGYAWAGMSAFDAAVHSMATIATGGMANYDASFAVFGPATQYVGTVFMLLGAMSFVRFVQFAAGHPRPLFADSQIRAFLVIYAIFAAGLLIARLLNGDVLSEPVLREVLFNLASIQTTTGFASTDYTKWGSFAVALFFCVGLICGCSGSTAGGPKVFRYQLLLAAVASEMRQLHSPNAVHVMRYQGRRVSPEVIDSVMGFFMLFFLTVGVGAVALVLLGLDPVTAISGATACISNIGPGLGPVIGPAGNFATVSDPAKLVFTFLMLVGRLEIMTVYVLCTAAFWRA
jgi:trk system potassium uptake protein TrkH